MFTNRDLALTSQLRSEMSNASSTVSNTMVSSEFSDYINSNTNGNLLDIDTTLKTNTSLITIEGNNVNNIINISKSDVENMATNLFPDLKIATTLLLDSQGGIDLTGPINGIVGNTIGSGRSVGNILSNPVGTISNKINDLTKGLTDIGGSITGGGINITNCEFGNLSFGLGSGFNINLPNLTFDCGKMLGGIFDSIGSGIKSIASSLGKGSFETNSGLAKLGSSISDSVSGSIDSLESMIEEASTGLTATVSSNISGLGISTSNTNDLVNDISNSGTMQRADISMSLRTNLSASPSWLITEELEKAAFAIFIGDREKLINVFKEAENTNISLNYESLGNTLSDINPKDESSIMFHIKNLENAMVNLKNAKKLSDQIVKEAITNEESRIENQQRLEKYSEIINPITETNFSIVSGFNSKIKRKRKEIISPEKNSKKEEIKTDLLTIINNIDLIKNNYIPEGIKDTNSKNVVFWKYLNNAKVEIQNINSEELANELLRSSHLLLIPIKNLENLLIHYTDGDDLETEIQNIITNLGDLIFKMNTISRGLSLF